MAKERFGRALMCSTVLRVPQAVYAKTILAKNCIPLSAYLRILMHYVLTNYCSDILHVYWYKIYTHELFQNYAAMHFK